MYSKLIRVPFSQFVKAISHKPGFPINRKWMTRHLQSFTPENTFGLELNAKDSQVIEGLSMQSLLMFKNLHQQLMHLQWEWIQKNIRESFFCPSK